MEAMRMTDVRDTTPAMFDLMDEGVGLEEFYVPSSKEDLISGGESVYLFLGPLTLDEILDVILDPADLEQLVKNTDLGVLSAEFVALASTLWHFKTMSSEFFRGTMNGLIAGVDLGLDRFRDVSRASGPSKLVFRSNFKVAVYLMCQYMDNLKQQIAESNSGTTPKKGVAKGRVEPWMHQLKTRALECIHALVDPRREWSSIWQQNPEPEFVRLLMLTSSRFCEETVIAKAESHGERNLIIKTFRDCILSFHCSGDFLDIMLKQFHRHDVCGTIVAEVVTLVSHKSGADIVQLTFSKLEESMDDIAQDNSIGRAFANLLSGIPPTLAVGCLGDIAELLQSDAHSVRIACIGILSGAILAHYKQRPAGSIPSATDRQTIEKCWDILLEQGRDSNAFVRCKVLHSILEVADESCISKRKYALIFEKVIERTGFGDKSQLVRKAALQCLTKLLELCPELLESSLDQLQAKLQRDGNALLNLLPEETANDFAKPWLRQSNWITTQRLISETAVAYATKPVVPQQVLDRISNKTFQSVINQVQQALEAVDGERAFYLLISAAEKFPGEEMVIDFHLQGLLREYGTAIAPHRMLSLLDCMKEILNRKEKKESRSAESIKAIFAALPRCTSQEARQAVSNFRVLQDDIGVRMLLTRCIPNWEKTLQMAVPSDITEICGFLINAESKGFSEAVYVLRRLPSFFSSSTREIRDAALSAYRKFFVGEEGENDLTNNPAPLVKKLMWELPCNSATSFDTIKVLFKNDNQKLMTAAKTAKMLIQIAGTSDRDEDVWRVCLGLSVLPASADKVIRDELDILYQRSVVQVNDHRLICAFCDVLIKLGKSPLAKEDITERDVRKLSMDMDHSITCRFLELCLLSFSDPQGAGQTQMYNKVIESLFAISPDSIATMRKLMYFTVSRVKLSLNALKSKSGITPASSQVAPDAGGTDAANEDSCSATVLAEVHYILYFGSTVVFTFANWMEDVFSVSCGSKDATEKGKNSNDTENEPDGPSEDDRGKAVVLQLRRTLFEVGEEEEGEGSAVRVLSRLIVHLCHQEAVASGYLGGLVAFMALIRLMLVSEHFCRTHLRFLLKALQTTESLELRKVLLVGLSDIAVRFVNIIQPHSARFITELHHPNPSIRYHALIALVRLVVNDLVKPRDQQCDMAILICDSDERVAAVARGYFKEKVSKLLERGDLYDRLGQSHVEQLLEYLIELAGKTPTDVEALFQIFLGTLEGIKPARTWRIAVYGLSLICAGPDVNEKLCTLMRERMSDLKSSLSDKATAASMLEVITTLRKKLPEEKKRIADDLTKMVKTISQQRTTHANSATKNKALGKNVNDSAETRVVRDNHPASESETDSESSDDSSHERAQTRKRPPAANKSVPKKMLGTLKKVPPVKRVSRVTNVPKHRR